MVAMKLEKRLELLKEKVQEELAGKPLLAYKRRR
jgi:hypothetical protein